MTDWRHQAVCRGEKPDLFFPNGNTGPALLQTEEAKAVCHRRCPVRDECLHWALESGQDFGVWGGLSEDERRALKRRQTRQRYAADAADTQDGAAEPTSTQVQEPSRDKGGRRLAECGTRAAYQRHVRRGEEIDPACRIANTRADRRLRNTGSTKALA